MEPPAWRYWVFHPAQPWRKYASSNLRRPGIPPQEAEANYCRQLANSDTSTDVST